MNNSGYSGRGLSPTGGDLPFGTPQQNFKNFGRSRVGRLASSAPSSRSSSPSRSIVKKKTVRQTTSGRIVHEEVQEFDNAGAQPRVVSSSKVYVTPTESMGPEPPSPVGDEVLHGMPRLPSSFQRATRPLRYEGRQAPTLFSESEAPPSPWTDLPTTPKRVLEDADRRAYVQGTRWQDRLDAETSSRTIDQRREALPRDIHAWRRKLLSDLNRIDVYDDFKPKAPLRKDGTGFSGQHYYKTLSGDSTKPSSFPGTPTQMAANLQGRTLGIRTQSLGSTLPTGPGLRRLFLTQTADSAFKSHQEGDLRGITPHVPGYQELADYSNFARIRPPDKSPRRTPHSPQRSPSSSTTCTCVDEDGTPLPPEMPDIDSAFVGRTLGHSAVPKGGEAVQIQQTIKEKNKVEEKKYNFESGSSRSSSGSRSKAQPQGDHSSVHSDSDSSWESAKKDIEKRLQEFTKMRMENRPSSGGDRIDKRPLPKKIRPMPFEEEEEECSSTTYEGKESGYYDYDPDAGPEFENLDSARTLVATPSSSEHKGGLGLNSANGGQEEMVGFTSPFRQVFTVAPMNATYDKNKPGKTEGVCSGPCMAYFQSLVSGRREGSESYSSGPGRGASYPSRNPPRGVAFDPRNATYEADIGVQCETCSGRPSVGSMSVGSRDSDYEPPYASYGPGNITYDPDIANTAFSELDPDSVTYNEADFANATFTTPGPANTGFIETSPANTTYGVPKAGNVTYNPPGSYCMPCSTSGYSLPGSQNVTYDIPRAANLTYPRAGPRSNATYSVPGGAVNATYNVPRGAADATYNVPRGSADRRGTRKYRTSDACKAPCGSRDVAPGGYSGAARPKMGTTVINEVSSVTERPDGAVEQYHEEVTEYYDDGSDYFWGTTALPSREENTFPYARGNVPVEYQRGDNVTFPRAGYVGADARFGQTAAAGFFDERQFQTYAGGFDPQRGQATYALPGRANVTYDIPANAGVADMASGQPGPQCQMCRTQGTPDYSFAPKYASTIIDPKSFEMEGRMKPSGVKFTREKECCCASNKKKYEAKMKERASKRGDRREEKKKRSPERSSGGGSPGRPRGSGEKAPPQETKGDNLDDANLPVDEVEQQLAESNPVSENPPSTDENPNPSDESSPKPSEGDTNKMDYSILLPSTDSLERIEKKEKEELLANLSRWQDARRKTVLEQHDKTQ